MAKSGSSKKLTEETIFGPLPDEVLQVADRIGLKRNVPISATNSFLKNRVPEKILEKDLKYQAYIFNEIKPPKKETSDAGDKRKKSNALTSDQRKRLFNLKDCKDITYAMFVEINSLWNEYIASIIDDLKSEADQLNFLRADYHGAFFVVSAAKNPALVGIKGFVVQETKNTFNIINKENRIQGKVLVSIHSTKS